MKLTELFAPFVEGLRPPEILTVSEWSDKYRILNQKSSAEPGPWRTSRTPYLQKIMDDLSDHSRVEMVSFMKGAQIGGTEAGNNWLGYIIDHSPGPLMVVMPTVDLAKRWSRHRLATMIEDMAELKGSIKDPRSRDSGNTVLLKEFDGGVAVISGANSGAGLRSMPVKYLMFDEVDAAPRDVDGEGDPFALAVNRTKTFARKKILAVSTPTQKGASRIERLYNEGSGERYHVPCPDCGELQDLEFEQLTWDKREDESPDLDSVRYVCKACGVLIEEHKKTWMLDPENGAKWIAERENDQHHSYHINSLYSPIGWESWADIVATWYKSKDDRESLITFVNTIKGLPFEDKGAKIEPHVLEGRAEAYDIGTCPGEVLFLTCGVDCQDDRLEAVVWGWSRLQRWVIEWRVFYGSPATSQVWEDLDEYLLSPFQHDSGARLKIRATAIDSGGHHTSEVYNFCRAREGRNVIAIKGHSQKGKQILGNATAVDKNKKGKTILKGAKVWMIGVDNAKSNIVNRLKEENSLAEGYIHFSHQLPTEFYKQLTSEKLAPRRVKGFLVWEWVKDPNVRNEVFDCSVYALAAYFKLGAHKWKVSEWQRLEAMFQPRTEDLFAAPEPVEDPSLTSSDDPDQSAPISRETSRPVRVKRRPGQGRQKQPGYIGRMIG